MTNIQQFAPNLYLTELHLDEFDVRGAVIVGSQRAVVWDTLSHPRDMQAVQPLVQDKHTIVVYSHADWDHIWGTAGLSYREIIAHDVAHERFFNDVPLVLHEKRQAQPGKWEEVQLIPPMMTFATQLNLDLGDVTVELHHLPGHTTDCCVAFIPEWGVLLGGDTIETPLPVVEEDSPMEVWLKALERWAQDERVKTVIPSHGEIGDRTIIQRNLTYLKALPEGKANDLLPAAMTGFYWETHQKNVEYATKKPE